MVATCWNFSALLLRRRLGAALRVLLGLSLLWLGNASALAANAPYTLTQIQAERLEIDSLAAISVKKTLEEIETRIAAVNDDPARLAGLYLLKAHRLIHSGQAAIDENLAKALPLINQEQHPEQYLHAMTIQAYGLYMYQNRAAEAVVLLEQVQQHPALQNDFYVRVISLGNLLEAYYLLKQYDKISKPLFMLIKTLSAKDVEPVYKNFFPDIEEELAYHSGQIGDIKQALVLSNKIIERTKLKNHTDNLAITNCNIANWYFLPLAEKFQYAKASLAVSNNVPCADVMEKLVLLEQVQQGDLTNIARLQQFNPAQQMPILNERSAYYAGLAYLHLNDLAAAQQMLNRLTDPNNWERYDLLQQLAAKQGDYQAAYAASQQYHQLRAQKDADARALMLGSYQTRLELAQEDTKAAEQAKQAEQLAAAEQKAQARLNLMLTVIAAGGVVTLVLVLYLYRSRRFQQKLQQLSDTDPLTGLLNRRAFMRQAEQLKLLAQRQQFPLSVVLIDLDFFKQINDQHGHQAGDAVLCAFADAAKATLRQTDVVARFGGEEFILMTSQQHADALASLLQRLQQCFQQMCLQDGEIGFSVSFSAGTAALNMQQEHNDPQAIEDAIRQADEQLYRAKGNGRQQVCMADICVPLMTMA
ncbi:GGDEF domain-containing protein [Rheinheimera texasensis]|uniref:GGDEF domain-containing protein n=1 Tax=Rheinheimera texasensis TaxID=306205 RepID=UPI001FE1E186|nr:GGDEF domain-containing protein [Rheinheimera texasensis]